MDPCNRPSDLVILLSSMASSSFSLADSGTICKALENSINRPYDKLAKKNVSSLLRTGEKKLNLRTDSQLKAMIKELPIFQSYTSTQLVRLSSNTVYAIHSSSGASIAENLFEKYLLVKSLVLIK